MPDHFFLLLKSRSILTVANCRKASVALWVALMMPALIVALALAMETSNWYSVQTSTQRAADAAARAGVQNYKATNNALYAATAASLMARLNGFSGAVAPTWNSATNTLSDNQITAQKVTGIKNSNDPAFKVTVTQSVPLSVSGMFSSQGSVPISATSTAELVTTQTGSGSGGQPCVVALSPGGTVATTGNINMMLSSCTMVSNGDVQFQQTSGTGRVSTFGIYAAGTIQVAGTVPLANTHPGSGTIPDPYASNTTVQNAINAAANLTVGSNGVYSHSCTSSGCTPALPNNSSCTRSGSTLTCTLYPGNYGSLAFAGVSFTLTFNPGLYLFQGGISYVKGTTSDTATFQGSGVTAVFNGPLNLGTVGTLYLALYAPGPAAAASSGGIAGISITGNASQLVFGTSGTFLMGGVIYLPKALIYASTATTIGAGVGKCAELIASSIMMSGSVIFDSGPCAQLGATSFTSVAPTSTSTASIVQ